MQKIRLSLIVLVCICTQGFAGSLEPPAGPDSPLSAMYSIEAIYQRLSDGTPGARRTGAFTEPPASPAPTMHDMNEVMAIAPSNVIDTVGATTNEVLSGQIFWGLTTNEWGTRSGAGDPDLISTNIRVDVTIFGVTGTVYECSVRKTGQTNSDLEGDDGWFSTNYGIAWPVPRFTIGTGPDGTNLVTDNLTGLMWARNAAMWEDAAVDWTNAVTNCNALVYGGHSDWRLPNIGELGSLIDWRWNPAVPNTEGTGQWSQNDPFTDVYQYGNWTSTTYRNDTAQAWLMQMHGGYGCRYGCDKTKSYRVWPVRGGP